MANKEGVELLATFARKKPNLESVKAEAMFRKFINGGFSYDEISNHPDYPVYASAQVLVFILPQIIDEMLARNDTGNFLIYHVISAIDPIGQNDREVVARAKEVISLIDKKTGDKIYKLLAALKNNPPVPVERLDKIIAFWRAKANQ
jgi:hypothetical protein